MRASSTMLADEVPHYRWWWLCLVDPNNLFRLRGLAAEFSGTDPPAEKIEGSCAVLRATGNAPS